MPCDRAVRLSVLRDVNTHELFQAGFYLEEQRNYSVGEGRKERGGMVLINHSRHILQREIQNPALNFEYFGTRELWT